MAIRFEDKKATELDQKTRPSGKAKRTERLPADNAESVSALPFAKPIRPEKKGRKLRQT